jgi:hypothetical protein
MNLTPVRFFNVTSTNSPPKLGGDASPEGRARQGEASREASGEVPFGTTPPRAFALGTPPNLGGEFVALNQFIFIPAFEPQAHSRLILGGEFCATRPPDPIAEIAFLNYIRGMRFLI